MASIYYITSQDGDIYQLGATLDIRIEDRGSLTSFKVESGSNESDNYTNHNIVASVSGKISDVNSGDERWMSTDKFITGLKAIKQSKKSFSFTWREDAGEGGVTYQLNSCMFTNLTIMQSSNSSTGYAQGSGKHSYDVSMGIEQFREFQGTVVTIESSDFIADMISEKKKGRGGTSGFDEGDVPRTPLEDSLGFQAEKYAKMFGG